MNINIKKTSDRAVIPSYKHPGEDACFDLSILIDINENIPMIANDNGFFKVSAEKITNGVTVGKDICIHPNEKFVFHTGLSFEIPTGYVMRIYDRSSTGIKRGLILSNGTAIIDSNYRGEVMLSFTNVTSHDVFLSDLDRVAQAEIAEVITADFSVVDKLSDTSRGVNGIGSTGVK